jgi:hypothetical protein
MKASRVCSALATCAEEYTDAGSLGYLEMSYEKRKQLFDNFKMLVTSEYEEFFRILKRNNEQYTENSNGIFFDVMTIKNETFSEMEKFMEFCIKVRTDEANRLKELKDLKQDSVISS